VRGASRLSACRLLIRWLCWWAGVEIIGGIAILLNFYAGDAALALLVVIVTAVVTTKIPILLGRPLGPFALAKLNITAG